VVELPGLVPGTAAQQLVHGRPAVGGERRPFGEAVEQQPAQYGVHPRRAAGGPGQPDRGLTQYGGAVLVDQAALADELARLAVVPRRRARDQVAPHRSREAVEDRREGGAANRRAAPGRAGTARPARQPYR